jgi:hypothetical protein
MAKVPELTVVVPLKLLVPDKVKVPVPDLLTEPVPLMAPA